MLGYRVRYATSAKLLGEFTTALADGCFARKLVEYARLDLLLIDEFGFDRLEREAQSQASTFYYRLLDARTGRRSTASATNIDFSAWADYLGDPPLAAAFLDRLVDGAVILKLSGRSYRAHCAGLSRRPVRPIPPERSLVTALARPRPLPAHNPTTCGDTKRVSPPPFRAPLSIRAATGEVVPIRPK